MCAKFENNVLNEAIALDWVVTCNFEVVKEVGCAPLGVNVVVLCENHRDRFTN